MTRALAVPHTDTPMWDEAPQPSQALIAILDDVEHAFLPPPASCTGPQPATERPPRPFAYD